MSPDSLVKIIKSLLRDGITTSSDTDGTAAQGVAHTGQHVLPDELPRLRLPPPGQRLGCTGWQGGRRGWRSSPVMSATSTGAAVPALCGSGTVNSCLAGRGRGRVGTRLLLRCNVEEETAGELRDAGRRGVGCRGPRALTEVVLGLAGSPSRQCGELTVALLRGSAPGEWRSGEGLARSGELLRTSSGPGEERLGELPSCVGLGLVASVGELPSGLAGRGSS